MGISQSKGSEYGKHFAPSSKTIPIYHGYDDSDPQRAQSYVTSGDADFIRARRAGDFHDQRRERDTAYFTYSKEYARKCAGRSGKIVRLDLPREFFHQHRMYKFDDHPADEWYQLVEANRRQNDLPRGRMNNIRKYELLEGPISEAATPAFVRSTGPLDRKRFKVARHDDHPNEEFVQQLAISGGALSSMNKLPRRFSP